MKPPRPGSCELCGRRKPLTFHHLIPRKVHRKRQYTAGYTRVELAQHGIWICRLCHRQIHRFFTESELAESYATLDDLRREPGMITFLGWAKKQR